MINLMRYYIALISYGARMMFMKVFMPSKYKRTMRMLKAIEEEFDRSIKRSQDTEFHDISFPSEVYALFTEGGGITDYGGSREHNEGEYVVHAGDDGQVYVLFFDNLDDAMSIADTYKAETLGECTVRRTFAASLGDDQNVRFYHMNGNIYDVSRTNFLKLVKD